MNDHNMDTHNPELSDDEGSSKAVLPSSILPLKIKNLTYDINLLTSEDDNNDKEENDDKVKSIAVVKSSSCPVEFRKLDLNTNLNEPPQNWLCTSINPSLQNALHTTLFGRKQDQFTSCSSFRIAHTFPNYVGMADVVADAEVIKSLLKIPYFKGPVSVIVHRIGNTLLIDFFDVKRCLLQIPDIKEYERLRGFLCWVAKQSSFNNTLYIKSRSRKKLQEKSLVSKFLCHSATQNAEENIDRPLSEPDDSPDPYPQIHKYNRNMYWKFESLKMLIGTDMPIFGQGTHPCISLRLHDMNKPISVLTGIDYWLDNLMCNVPEVAMCYHLNGIVQNYELYKTDDLPGLENSQFSSAIIADIAKSILTFLKSNATKAGHTYWLFKPNNQDVVKLYDLTSLCSKNVPNKDSSPFILPVAMLLYRCACSILYSSDKYQPSIVRMLLENCVELLTKEKYPEIVTSSHFMLAELYIPFDIVPELPIFKTEDIEQTFDDDLPAFNTQNMSVGDLSTDERCLSALHHVAMALNSLQCFQNKKEKEEEVVMAKPSEAIPMPYEKLNKTTTLPKSGKKKKKDKKETCKNELGDSLLSTTNVKALPLPAWKDFNGDDESWRNQLKMRLYEKSKLIYATLIEFYYKNLNCGIGLRCLNLLIRCNQIGANIYSSSNTLIMSSLLTKAGDYCILYAHDWNQVEIYQKAYNTYFEQEEEMIKQLELDEKKYGRKGPEINLSLLDNYENLTFKQVIKKGIDFYNEALEYRNLKSIYSKLGYAYNELGRHCLEQTRTSLSSLTPTLCEKARKYLEKALDFFKKGASEMSSNCAFVYCNLAHLHRILAAFGFEQYARLGEDRDLEFSNAASNYRIAIKILDKIEGYTTIRDNIKWDFTSNEFTRAFLMHEYIKNCDPSLVSDQDILKAFGKLEKVSSYCNVSRMDLNYVQYRELFGKVCVYMPSLELIMLKKGHKEVLLEQTLIEKLYNDASNCFTELKNFSLLVCTQQERCKFYMYLSNEMEDVRFKLSYITTSLQGVYCMRKVIECELDAMSEEVAEDLLTSLNELKADVQKALLNLIKLSKQLALSSKDIYTECYRKSLFKESSTNAKEIIKNLLTILAEIETDLKKPTEMA